MATSPNYAWAEPDNSSLVKNGASDIRTLGDAIDTSVWNVGFGQAGKNKIINGDFSINQRSFTTTTTGNVYGFDRWQLNSSDGTTTYSAQTFTPGAAPVAGYESTNFARVVSTGQTATSALSAISERIEDVRTFAGQTMTVSFWAKASSGTPNVVVWCRQSFGSGGSAIVEIGSTKKAITTAWARYTFTINVPSISGKTIGSGNFFHLFLVTSAGTDRNAYTDSLGIQSATIDFWGVQAEYGSKATPFQTATGTIQGELAACQRYYYRVVAGGTNGSFGIGQAVAGTGGYVTIPYPVTMRTAPSTLEQTGTASNYAVFNASSSLIACSSVPSLVSGYSGANNGFINFSVASGLSAGNAAVFYANSSATAYLGFSAEL